MMQQMKMMSRAAMVETKALHDRAVTEIVTWLHNIKGIVAARVTKQQEYYGDFWYQIHPNGLPIYVLIKAEEENRYGNFFLETWRNKAGGERGWLHKECIAKYLGYYFRMEGELYMIDLPQLKLWAFAFGNIQKFPEKEQFKRMQENDARGRVVPIQTVMRSVKSHKYILRK